MSVSLDPKCPAAEMIHPVLSPNQDDVLCRIQGGLRPARERDGRPVVCCAAYDHCNIWRHHVEIDRGPSTKKQRDQTLSDPHQHTLSGNPVRERISGV